MVYLFTCFDSFTIYPVQHKAYILWYTTNVKEVVDKESPKWEKAYILWYTTNVKEVVDKESPKWENKTATKICQSNVWDTRSGCLIK